MALTKISGEVIQSNIDISSTGIITATTFSGNVTGDLTGNVTGNINSTGVSTVTTLNATTISGVSTIGVTTATVTTLNATTISGVSTIGVTTATVTTLTVNGNNYPSAGPLSNRNKIINGAMQVAQRGTSKAYAGTGQNPNTYDTLDRFLFGSFGTYPSGTYSTVEQIADAPSNSGFINSLKVTANQTLTVGSSNARGVWIIQQVEGYNTVDLLNKPITISFWVKSSNTGTYSFAVQGTGSVAAYATSYTISTTDWEYKTITLTHSDSLYTPNTTNGIGLTLNWTLLGDDTWIGTATANQWVSANAPYLHGTKNLFDTASATWQITGVQLEVGTVATPFEHRSYGEELALCQRYCEIWQPASSFYSSPGAGYNSLYRSWIPFKVEKRTTPAVSTYGIGGYPNNVNQVDTDGVGNDSVTYTIITQYGFRVENVSSPYSFQCGMSAFAEL